MTRSANEIAHRVHDFPHQRGPRWTWLRGARQVDVVLAGLTRIRAHRSIGGPRSVCGERQQHPPGQPDGGTQPHQPPRPISDHRHISEPTTTFPGPGLPGPGPGAAASPVWPNGMPRL